MTTSSTNLTGLYGGGDGGAIPNTAYGNANVVGLLAAGTDGGNTVGNISATGNITAGNVTANYFIGDGSKLTNINAGNIVGGYGNANVAAFLTTYGGAVDATEVSNTALVNIASEGTVQMQYDPSGNYDPYTIDSGSWAYLDSNGFNFESNVTGTGQAVYLDNAGNVTATGNVQGNYFIGNGSQLTGLPATYSNANVSTYLASGTNSANIITTANIAGSYILGNGSQLTGLPATYSNANVSTYLASGTNSANIITTANIAGSYILGNGSQLTGLPTGYSNAAVATFLADFGSNTISTTGNVTAGNFIGNGAALTSITGANVTGTVANATYAATAGLAAYITANAQANITSVGTLTSLSTTGNISTLGNVDVQGMISAVGNIVTDGYFVGNFAGNITGNLTVPGSNTQVLFNNQGNAGAVGGFTYDKDANTMTVLGVVSAQGNVIGGNVTTAGIVSATGNIDGGNLNTSGGAYVTGVVSAAGNVRGGNINTGGLVSATGNLIGGNVTTAGIFEGNAAGLTNIPGANVTGTVANATYATTAGSATTAGTVTGNAQANITSVGTLTSLNASGNISTTGNVTAGYYFGNGSQLTGIVSSYGNSNVVSMLAANTFIGVGNVNTYNTLANAVQMFVGKDTSIQSGYPAVPNSAIFNYNLYYADNGNATVRNTETGAMQFRADGTGFSFGGQTGSLTANAPASLSSFATIQASGITTNNGGNLTIAGLASVTGNITGGNLVVAANGNANINGGNINNINWSLANVHYSASQLSVAGATILGATPTSVDLIGNNKTAGTINIGGFAQTGQITVAAGNLTQTLALGTGLTASANTKTINLGTGGLAGSTSNIFIGPTTGNGLVQFNSATQVTMGNTLSVAGNVTGGNLSTAGQVSATANIIGGNILTGGLISATGTLTSGQLTSTYTPGTNTGAGINALGANTQGGTGYFDFLKITNQSGNVTNPSKTFRLTGNGSLEIVNSDYTTVLSILSEAGAFTVPGLVRAGSVSYANFDGSAGQVLTTYGNGITYWSTGGGGSYGNADVASYLASGTNTSNIITTGNISGTVFLGSGAGLTNLNAANVTGTVPNATLAQYVTANAQANITSVGTLTSLSVSGNVDAGNLQTAGLVSATGNVTSGNINTAGLVSATGNVTGAWTIGTTALQARNTSVIGNIVAAPGNIVIAKTFGSDGIYNPEGSSASVMANGQVIMGYGYNGNVNANAVTTNSQAQGTRFLMWDYVQRGNSAAQARELSSVRQVELTANVTNASFREIAMAGHLQVGGGASAYSASTTNPFFFNALNGRLQFGNDGVGPNMGNVTSSHGTAGVFTVVANPGASIGNAISVLTNLQTSAATANITNAVGINFFAAGNASTVTNYYGVALTGSTNTFGGTISDTIRATTTNYYYLYNTDNLAQSQLGPLRSYQEVNYTSGTSGTVNVDKQNGQVQTIVPTANVTIGSFTNFVTTASITAGSTKTTQQTDTITLIIKQGATPYTITMPTGNAAIKYASNVSTVANTANAVTMMSITAANIAGTNTYMVTISPEFI